jgi:hypothetical protein
MNIEQLQSAAKDGKLPWNDQYLYKGIYPLPDDFIETYFNYINWWFYFDHFKPSAEWVSGNKHRIDWTALIAKTQLSEDQLEEFLAGLTDQESNPKLNEYRWELICGRQVVSENFLRRHVNKLHWQGVVAKQNISEEFVLEYTQHINPRWLAVRQEFSEEFVGGVAKIKEDREIALAAAAKKASIAAKKAATRAANKAKKQVEKQAAEQAA